MKGPFTDAHLGTTNPDLRLLQEWEYICRHPDLSSKFDYVRTVGTSSSAFLLVLIPPVTRGGLVGASTISLEGGWAIPKNDSITIPASVVCSLSEKPTFCGSLRIPLIVVASVKSNLEKLTVRLRKWHRSNVLSLAMAACERSCFRIKQSSRHHNILIPSP